MNMLYALVCGVFVTLGCQAAGVNPWACIFLGIAALAALISLWLTSQEIGR